jgi:hypothetical protein
MMMDEIYITAFCPPQPVVLGKQLLPLSMGHTVLLEGGDSIFLRQQPGRDATVQDLAMAVWVCSQQASVLRFEQRDAPDTEELVQWGLDCRPADIDAEIRMFTQYLSSSLRMPRAWTDSSSKAPVAPWQYSVAAVLIEAGWERDYVWDGPIAEILAGFAALQERHGLDLVSPQEQEVIDAMEDEA